MIKANLLMNDRRFAEAEVTMRRLLTTRLSAAQASQVERVLDAIHAAVLASPDNACRKLLVALHAAYAADGRSPVALSLGNLPQWDHVFESEIAASLSSIESYEASCDTFSFVAVAKETRRRVTERGIERNFVQ